MRRQLIASAVAIVLSTASLAGATPTQAWVDAFNSVMFSGTTGSCSADGGGTVEGSGPGLPLAFSTPYEFVLHGYTALAGELALCGSLLPLPFEIGASCGFHSGNAQGTYYARHLKDDREYHLELAWAATVPQADYGFPFSGLDKPVLVEELVVATGTWTLGSTSGPAVVTWRTVGSEMCWEPSGAWARLAIGTVSLL